jgi:hypothetical protein
MGCDDSRPANIGNGKLSRMPKKNNPNPPKWNSAAMILTLLLFVSD